jgi:hypothetical protein
LKWILTIAAIWFGSTYLGPWERSLVTISGKFGMASLTDPEYLHFEKMHVGFSAVQILLLFTIIFISIFKPWKAMRSKKK